MGTKQDLLPPEHETKHGRLKRAENKLNNATQSPNGDWNIPPLSEGELAALHEAVYERLGQGQRKERQTRFP